MNKSEFEDSINVYKWIIETNNRIQSLVDFINTSDPEISRVFDRDLVNSLGELQQRFFNNHATEFVNVGGKHFNVLRNIDLTQEQREELRGKDE